MGDAQLLEIVNAGGEAGEGDHGTAFGEGEKFAAMFFADAGGVGRGKVADMYLPNDRVVGFIYKDMTVILPTLGVRLSEINDLGTF